MLKQIHVGFVGAGARGAQTGPKQSVLRADKHVDEVKHVLAARLCLERRDEIRKCDANAAPRVRCEGLNLSEERFAVTVFDEPCIHASLYKAGTRVERQCLQAKRVLVPVEVLPVVNRARSVLAVQELATVDMFPATSRQCRDKNMQEPQRDATIAHRHSVCLLGRDLTLDAA